MPRSRSTRYSSRSSSSSKSSKSSGGVRQYYGRPGTPGSTIPAGGSGSKSSKSSGGVRQYYGRPGTPGSTIPAGGSGSKSSKSSGGVRQYYGRPGTPGSTIPAESQAVSQALSVYRPDGTTTNPTSAEGQQMTAVARRMGGRRYGRESVRQSERPVEVNPFGEFTKGMTEGFTDLAITGENIGRLATGKEMKETTGNVLTKSIDTMIDAFSDDDPNDFKQIQQGFEKIGEDFWKNPARGVGRLMPEIAITVASRIRPASSRRKMGPARGQGGNEGGQGGQGTQDADKPGSVRAG